MQTSGSSIATKRDSSLERYPIQTNPSFTRSRTSLSSRGTKVNHSARSMTLRKEWLTILRLILISQTIGTLSSKKTRSRRLGCIRLMVASQNGKSRYLPILKRQSNVVSSTTVCIKEACSIHLNALSTMMSLKSRSRGSTESRQLCFNGSLNLLTIIPKGNSKQVLYKWPLWTLTLLRRTTRQSCLGKQTITSEVRGRSLTTLIEKRASRLMEHQLGRLRRQRRQCKSLRHLQRVESIVSFSRRHQPSSNLTSSHNFTSTAFSKGTTKCTLQGSTSCCITERST